MDERQAEGPAPEGSGPDAEAPAAGTPGLVRLGEWVFGAPSPERADTDDYRRYQALLPAMLAGALPAGSADARWFEAYLAECEPCVTEYEELRETLEADRAARLAFDPDVDPVPAWPAYDLAFLRPGAAAPAAPGMLERARAVWAGAIRPTLRTWVAAGRLWAEIAFAVPPELPPAIHQVAAATPDPPPGETRLLLARTIGPDPAAGIALQYLVRVEAARLDAGPARLTLTVATPRQPAAAAGLTMIVERPGAPAVSAVTDAAGRAEIPVPLAALPDLTIRLALA